MSRDACLTQGSAVQSSTPAGKPLAGFVAQLLGNQWLVLSFTLPHCNFSSSCRWFCDGFVIKNSSTLLQFVPTKYTIIHGFKIINRVIFILQVGETKLPTTGSFMSNLGIGRYNGTKNQQRLGGLFIEKIYMFRYCRYLRQDKQ